MTVKVFFDVARPKRERLRLTVAPFNGRQVIQLRCWFLDAEGELRAGRAGVSIPAASVPELCTALADAARFAADSE